MNLLELKEKVKSGSDEVVKRIDPRTTGGIWAKIRNVAGITAAVGGLVLIMPVSLPATVVGWVTWITTASSLIAGGANLDKSKYAKERLQEPEISQ